MNTSKPPLESHVDSRLNQYSLVNYSVDEQDAPFSFSSIGDERVQYNIYTLSIQLCPYIAQKGSCCLYDSLVPTTWD